MRRINGQDATWFQRRLRNTRGVIMYKNSDPNCKNVKKNVFICFIDYDKPFDTIRFLYWQQTVYVSINYDITEEFISRGVRQGCILSPLLFNVVGLYSCGFPRGGVT